ncbi:hypothetical protein T459_15918 [Capsicum annuum]|uniref:Uncharacterized protein n=1 Tax=Capsicum annuum TaxID=4072 RepID=A0A2G2Z782_CAPAN|nr:hypothetical protein T459_15918 [Capsicum annuum]
MLSLAFAGDSCCKAGDNEISLDVQLFSSVSFEACKMLAQKLPGLNVEVIDERGDPDTGTQSFPVEKLYIYRTVCSAGYGGVEARESSILPFVERLCSN